jgi:uncharacterized protein (DUF983 family)
MTPEQGSPRSNGEEAARYVGVEVITECPKCGDKVPLNGLERKTVCDNCSHEFEISPAFWLNLLEEADDCHNEISEGQKMTCSPSFGSGTKIVYGPEHPTCQECGERLPVAETPKGHRGEVTCASCTKSMPTCPTPEWLSELLPSCKQVYGGWMADQGAKTEVQGDHQAKNPIAMSCPQCAAGLSFTSAESRLVPCEYCGADVYLPDAIWKRLHPVKTREHWFLCFEGLSKKALERVREEKQEEEWRREREQEAWAEQQRRIDRAAAADQAQTASSVGSWVIFLAVFGGVAFLILLMFILMG